MARRGGRRTYVRDGRGRFASTPGGGKKAPSGLLSRQPRKAGTPPPRRRGLVLQRASAKRSKAKLAAMDPKAGSYSASLKRRAQKAAVTRTGNKLQAAQQRGRIRLGARAGVIKPGQARKILPGARFLINKYGLKDREANWMIRNPKTAAAIEKRVEAISSSRGVSVRSPVARGILLAEIAHFSNRSDKVGKRGPSILAKPKPGGKAPAAAKSKAASAKPKPQQAVLGPNQIAGARKRASETPEAFAKRKLDRVRFKLNQLSERKGLQESDLNRRRGRLEGDARKKAARALRKTQKSISQLKEAEQRYSTTVTRRQDERNWNLMVRTGRKAPANQRTAMNRLNIMQRRVSYLRKNEDRPRNTWGEAYAGPKLNQASAARGVAIAGIAGQRYSFRSRAGAVAAQRQRRDRTIGKISRKPFGQLRENYGTNSIYKFYRRGTSMQGDLLTGGFKKTKSGNFRPAPGYSKPKRKARRR